jgi:leucyl/phenylalanyl-tRNA--protein transferase
MPLHILEDKIWFPPAEDAMEDGLLAIGGELSVERVLAAYSKGIFPWYDGDIPLWWSPDPRFVLFPDELKVSKSMQKLLKKNAFQFTVNKDFEGVIHNCRILERKDQDGTWINDAVEKVYTQLHTLGHAISAEVWKDEKLVGGLYGVIVNKVFCGESMFSKESNASKYALIKLVQHLVKQGIELIDCQVYTEHLESLGAREIERKEFLRFLSFKV